MPEAFVSVIVPVYNGKETIGACLAALQRAKDDSTEILVVDDGSTDDSAVIARDADVRVIANGHLKGPAGARNQGAEHAAGSILFFVDADVVVRENAVVQIRNTFVTHPELSAVFGSYDREPAAPNFVSQYKNLFHHYVHQTAREESSSFWAGCGAVRADAFREMGGFDEKAYPNPSIEDIELGWRLSRSGRKTRLEKNLQVKHLKKWTPTGLLKADIFLRAVPWTRLIAASGKVPNDLNVHASQRISALLAWGAVDAAAFAFLSQWLAAIAVACAAGVIAMNFDFYRFFVRNRGAWFTAGVFFWHMLYFLYSSATFTICWIYYKMNPAEAL